MTISLGHLKTSRDISSSETKKIQSNHIRIRVGRLSSFSVRKLSKLIFLSREVFFMWFEESD